jgi:hypothetical protein
MSGGSDNQLNFIFPNSVYTYLNAGEGEISQADCDRLVENINKFDPCGKETLKTHLKRLLPRDGSSINSSKIDEIECIDDKLKQKIKDANIKTDEELTKFCATIFNEEYNMLDLNHSVLKTIQDNLNLNNAKLLLNNFNFIDENGVNVSIDKIKFESLPGASTEYNDESLAGVSGLFEGGAYYLNKRIRLNLLKNSSGVPVLFTALPPHTDYLTKRWRGEPATYSPVSSSSSSSSTSSNPADCSPDFNSGLDKRHIKPWTPRKSGSSASTLNAMSHLRRMASQPRITQVDVASIPFMRAFGITGGSMEGGAPLDLTFSDCASGNDKEDKLSIRQSTQYLDLFKSVVQRLNKHNPVDTGVITRLESDLNAYRNAECKLFQDAFRLANALKSQNNGTLSGNITDLEAFTEASDEVAKSETHLLGCLTEILTKACDKP